MKQRYSPDTQTKEFEEITKGTPPEAIVFTDISSLIRNQFSTLEDTNPCPSQSCKRCDLVFGDCEKISS